MSDQIFALVPAYGGWILMIATLLSCLAVPIPTAFLMLAAGAFAASGDLGLGAVAGAAWVGAILGDQIGFRIGVRGGARLVVGLERHPRRAALIGAARMRLQRWGGIAVFLSRWLFSPLGPYVNFLAGASALDWRVFTLWSVLGEALWVVIYIGLGFVFSGQIAQIGALLGNAAGMLAAGAVAVLLGVLLMRGVSGKGGTSGGRS